MPLTHITTREGEFPVHLVNPHDLQAGNRIIAPDRDNELCLMTVRSAHGTLLAIEGRQGMLQTPSWGVYRVVGAGGSDG